MRYGCEHRSETRSRIVRSAAREMRGKGPDRVGVAAVMVDAGLTHGGFYAHFASKDALVAEAVEAMFADGRRQMRPLDEVPAGDPARLRAALRDYLSAYLSPRHRDGAENGCPLPSLSSDMARSSGVARQRFAGGAADLLARMESVMARLGRDEPAVEANSVLAQMVGAVALARALGPGDPSDTLLRDTLATLVARLGL